MTVEILTTEHHEVVLPVIVSSTQEAYLLPTSGPHRMYFSDIPMQVDTPWSVTVTIEVTPKVPKVEFMPYVCVVWNGEGWTWFPSTGTTSGSFVSCGWEEMGTWTWSANGDYVWEWWRQPPPFIVGLHARSEPLGGN